MPAGAPGAGRVVIAYALCSQIPGNVNSSVPTNAYGNAGPLFIFSTMIRLALSFALMMKTMFPATARPVQTPTGSLYMSWPGPSAMPLLSVSVKRRSSPDDSQ